MIFPNRAPDPQLRPGMGYQGGSHALLGYEPGADALGYVAGRMGYSAGASHLGAVSAAELQVAYDAGLDGDTLDALSAIGATDADIQALIAGTTDVASIQAKYAHTGSTEGTTVTGGATPAPSSTAQVPSGSTILYTASFNSQKALITASAVISDIAAQLTSHGMSMISSAVQASGWTSEASFTMTILDSVGHNLLSDAQSVMDSILNQYTSGGKLSSSVTLVSPGTTASGIPNPGSQPASDPLTFLENNAMYIGLGIGALVLLNNFTGKRR